MTNTVGAGGKVTLVIRSAVSTWTVKVYGFQVDGIIEAFRTGKVFSVKVSEGDPWCSEEKTMHFNSLALTAIEVN